MTDIEIPLGKRTRTYRFFEILPGAISIGAIVLLIVLSIFSPTAAAFYILLLVLYTFVQAVATAFRTIQGRRTLAKYVAIDWQKWLADLGHPKAALREYEKYSAKQVKKSYKLYEHINNLRMVKESSRYPRPEQIYNAVIITIYNEKYEVLGPTLENLSRVNYDIKNNLVVFIAYEERGGKAAEETVKQIKEHYTGVFRDLVFSKHPAGLPDEVVGKGPNLCYAGPKVSAWFAEHKIDSHNVIVTTLDSDNKPDKQYFSYLTYTWIMTPNRQQCAFQPICLFNNNLWDVPAPMRVVAISNSFWNVISSMRPYTLKNFASHSQGLWPLEQMNYWSRRTIVEDGHQYWRSYFYFDGDYEVVPLHIGVGQDAVLSSTYWKTLKAQFIQMRRWAYGASDDAYIATHLMNKEFKGDKRDGWFRFLLSLNSHTTLACMAPIVGFGAFAPLYINPLAAHTSIIANDLPLIVSHVQQIATLGLLVTVATSISLLPPRPKSYGKQWNIIMIVQWVLMPINAIVYSSASAYVAQWRLLTGHYMEKFDVTEKAVKKAGDKLNKKSRKEKEAKKVARKAKKANEKSAKSKSRKDK